MPEALRLYVQRIERDDAYILGLLADVTAFADDLDALVLELETMHLPKLKEAA